MPKTKFTKRVGKVIKRFESGLQQSPKVIKRIRKSPITKFGLNFSRAVDKEIGMGKFPQTKKKGLFI